MGSLPVGNTRSISGPRNYRHTLCDGCKTFEIKYIEGAVGTWLFHNIGNPNHHSRYKLVCKQKMVIGGGTESGNWRIRPLQRQFQLDCSTCQIIWRDGSYTEGQFLVRRIIIRVEGVQHGRPVGRDRHINLEATGDLGGCFQDLLQQFDPVVRAPSVGLRFWIVIVYAARHQHRHLHTTKTLFRQFGDLFVDVVVVILAGTGIWKPHACHRFCMDIWVQKPREHRPRALCRPAIP